LAVARRAAAPPAAVAAVLPGAGAAHRAHRVGPPVLARLAARVPRGTAAAASSIGCQHSALSASALEGDARRLEIQAATAAAASSGPDLSGTAIAVLTAARGAATASATDVEHAARADGDALDCIELHGAAARAAVARRAIVRPIFDTAA